ncbi:MAG TPA: methyltransferase dimerization domain-containing protein, partial [Sphingomicrobium sp.]|nr:methyltransferase dimerization domain-containing protein [Sphingomicrobium sp.]
MNERPLPDRILQLGFGFWGSKAVLSAVELGLFTELARSPADASAVAQRLGLHSRSARDFLDALVALNVLEREDGIYRNTAVTDLYLDRAKPSYIGGILEMANARLYRFWGSLTEALRTGEPQNESKGSGEDLFGPLYADPDRLKVFLAAMSGISAGPAQAIAEQFPWGDYATFVDVGCAQGMVPVTLVRNHPHLSGYGFDLPEVKPIFEEF